MKLSNPFTVNLADQMTAAKRRVVAHDEAILAEEAKMRAEVSKLIDESKALAKADDHLELMQTLGLNYHVAEATRVRESRAAWGHLPQERIFTTAAIRETCIKYNLRFLSSSLYRGVLDEGIGAKVEELKSLNGGALPAGYLTGGASEFFIAAPKESFVLQERPKDPLLFCRLDRDHYYLIHKWGKDLSVMRRLSTLWLTYWMRIIPIACTLTGAVVFPMWVPHESFWITIPFGAFFGGIAPIFACAMAASNYSVPADVWNSPFRNRD